VRHDDVALINHVVTALAAEESYPPARRTGPTQLWVALPNSTTGYDEGAGYVDVADGEVLVSCYPLPPIPEGRIRAVAELMNLIARTGVPFRLALDLENRVVSLRNIIHIGTVSLGRDQMLRGLILGVVNSCALYERPLHDVAFESVKPAAALAAVERILASR
jgi:hypothetical protein